MKKLFASIIAVIGMPLAIYGKKLAISCQTYMVKSMVAQLCHMPDEEREAKRMMKKFAARAEFVSRLLMALHSPKALFYNHKALMSAIRAENEKIRAKLAAKTIPVPMDLKPEFTEILN
jgi:hypothetical protein